MSLCSGLLSEPTKRGIGCGELQLFLGLNNAGDGSTRRLPLLGVALRSYG
jgi:hypothetical protein